MMEGGALPHRGTGLAGTAGGEGSSFPSDDEGREHSDAEQEQAEAAAAAGSGVVQTLKLGSDSDDSEEEENQEDEEAGSQATPSRRSTEDRGGVDSVARLIRETKQAPPLVDRWTLLPQQGEAQSSLQRWTESRNTEMQLRERVGVLTELYEGARILAEAVPSLKAELKTLRKNLASHRSESASLRKERAALKKERDQLEQQLRLQGTEKDKKAAVDKAVKSAVAKRTKELEAKWSAKMERELAEKDAECVDGLTQLLSEKMVMQTRAVARAAHRLQNAVVASALSGWMEYVEQKKAACATMRKVAQRIRLMGCARILSKWAQYVDEAKHMKLTMQRVIKRLQNIAAAAMLVSWKQYTQTRVAIRTTLRKVVKRISLMAGARALDGWRQTTARRLRSRRIIGKLAIRIQQRVVAASFGSLCDWCHASRTRRVRMWRVATLWDQRRLRRAFLGWSGDGRKSFVESAVVANPARQVYSSSAPQLTKSVAHATQGSQTSPVHVALPLCDRRARGTQTKRLVNPDVSLSKHCACCPASRVDVVYSETGASLSLAFTAKALADARSAYYAVSANDDGRTEPEPEPEQPPEQQLDRHQQQQQQQQQLAMPDRRQRDELFGRFDFNGNGMLSLAEIDKAVLELWPHFDHKRALMRAYKAADVNDDGFIRRREFRLLLKYIVYFDAMWARFDEIDRDRDHRLTQAEFAQGCAVMGIQLSRSVAAAEFEAMDENGGGFILFDEFCHWCARRQVPVEGEGLTAEESETLCRPTPTKSASRIRSTPPSTPPRRAGRVMQDAGQQVDPEDAISEPEASANFQVVKAGYLDKQLRKQQRQKGAAANTKQHGSSDIDGIWKQRYVEVVVDTPDSTTTTCQETTAKTSRARLVFRHAPGGRELGAVPLLPSTTRSTVSSNSTGISPTPVSGVMDGTRIVRSSRSRQQREHQNSNTVWSMFTVESPTADDTSGSSSRQVSFSALDHGTVSEWCSAMERAMQLVAEPNSSE
jgi:Ca2+-binding EF-hand superfamily protein